MSELHISVVEGNLLVRAQEDSVALFLPDCSVIVGHVKVLPNTYVLVWENSLGKRQVCAVISYGDGILAHGTVVEMQDQRDLPALTELDGVKED